MELYLQELYPKGTTPQRQGAPVPHKGGSGICGGKSAARLETRTGAAASGAAAAASETGATVSLTGTGLQLREMEQGLQLKEQEQGLQLQEHGTRSSQLTWTTSREPAWAGSSGLEVSLGGVFEGVFGAGVGGRALRTSYL